MNGGGAPLVSVVMPVHNGEDTIQSCIDSILAQTLADFEFLIVDDYSDDGTLERIKGRPDPRVRVLKNGGQRGMSPALNVGLEAARGRFIARMDCDDLSATNRFERQVAFLEAHPEVGVCGTFQEIFGGYRDGFSRTAVTDREIRVSLLVGATMKHPTVMFRASVLREHRLRYDTSLPHAEDYDMWIRASKVTQLHNLPEFLGRYRWESRKIWETDKPVMTDCLFAVWTRQLADLGLDPGREELELYRRVLEGGRLGDMAELLRARAVLRDMLESNGRKGLYDAALMSRLFSRSWRRACRSLARRSWRACAAYGASFLAPSSLWAP
jgi:Glycosyl transferase family 2